MKSALWRDSQFWTEKVRHIYEILNSIRGHGHFSLLCDDWSRTAKEDCIAELDQLIGVLQEWKGELERQIGGSHRYPVVTPAGRAAPPRAAHLRIASFSGSPKK